MIAAGSDYANPGVLLPGQPVLHGRGYDGQFYFYIAQDPLLRSPATRAALDNTFRVRRILYPLLAWALSLGQRPALPYLLALVNLLAATGLVAVAARRAAAAGRGPWSVLLLAVYPGVWIPLLLDLTEPLQLLLLALGVVLASAPALFLAALAKETAGIALATEAARHAAARRWRPAAAHAALAALFVAWALFIHAAVSGVSHNDLGAFFLDPPGAPFRLLAGGGLPAVVLLPAVAVSVLAVARLAVSRDAATLAAAGYALLALGAGNDTWLDPAAYFRVTAGALVLTYLGWTATGDRLGLAALLTGAAAAALALPAILLR